MDTLCGVSLGQSPIMILRQTMEAVQVSEARHYIAFPGDASYAYLLLQDHCYSPCSSFIYFLAIEWHNVL